MTESLTQRERQIKKLLESIKSYRLTDSELKMMKRAQL
jgi:DNA-binding CsgD family transcriptional regulator